MEILSHVLLHYALLTAWLLACLVAGIAFRGVLSGKAPGSPTWTNPELALFIAISLGLALHIAVLTLLGVFNLLTPVLILLTLAALTVGAAVSIALQPGLKDGFVDTFHLERGEWLKVLPVILLILAWILRPLGPPEGSDSLTYHLPYARFYLENGGLAVNDTLRFPLHTHNVNMLYVAAMIRPNATLPQMLHAWMGLLAVLGVYGFARHWHGWVAATLTAVGVLLSWEYLRAFEYAYADNGLVLFLTAAFLCLGLWIEDRQKHLLWACAVFAGTAMGSKYFGALFTVPLGLAVLWFSRDIRLTVKFTLLTALFGLFWYVRSWLVSGNPVHPFASGLFGYYIWSAADVAGQMSELSSHGIDRSWLNFLLLPERLFSERLSFSGNPKLAKEHLGVLVGFFMAGCLLFRWQRPFVRLLQASCLAYLAFWFVNSQIARYLLFTTPLMSLAAVTAWVAFLTRPGGWPGRDNLRRAADGLDWLERPARNLLLTFLVLFTTLNIAADLNQVPLSGDERDAYLRKTRPSSTFMRAAGNEPRIGDGPILQFQFAEARYFFDGAVYGDWMGRFPWRRYGHIGPSGYWEINDSRTLHRQVCAEGFTAVLMNKRQGIQFMPQEISSYEEHFEILLENPDGVLMIPDPCPGDGPVES